jgi:hypothetical protein
MQEQDETHPFMHKSVHIVPKKKKKTPVGTGRPWFVYIGNE